MFLRDFTRHAATPVSATVSHPVQTGLIAETLVETRAGWQHATALRIGDAVQTLDGGAARIVALDRQELACGTPLIHLPGGLLDSCADLLLLPRQTLLIDSCGAHDAPYVLITASTLLTLPGVTLHRPAQRIEVVRPIFAAEEAVWAQSGLLLHCPGTLAVDSFFPVPTATAARRLLADRARLAA